MEQAVFFTDDLIRSQKEGEHKIQPYKIGDRNIKSSGSVSMIAAVARDGAIGNAGTLLWHIPEDLKHFKELTQSAMIVMGRKTWESLPKKPLLGRLNVVISSNPNYRALGALTFTSLEEALRLGRNMKIFIIGGGILYREGLKYADKIYLTEVLEDYEAADTFFPAIPEAEWRVEEISEVHTSSTGIKYRFVNYIRKI